MRNIPTVMTAVAAVTLGLGGCVTTPPNPTPKAVSETFREIRSAFEAESTMTPQTFAQAGLHAIDLRCDAFFARIAQADRRASGYQGAISLLGGTVAGYGAATGQSAEDIAIAALLFSGLDAQIANYRQFELLGPFASTASRLVREAQAAYRAQPVPATRIEAVDYVHGYAQLCAADTITGYINAAISNANPVLVEAGASRVSRLDRDIAVAAITPAAPGAAQLTDDEWARLYIYLEDGPASAALIQQFSDEFPVLRTELMTSATPAQLQPAGTTVRDQLRALRVRSSGFAAATQRLRAERAVLQATSDAAFKANNPHVGLLNNRPQGAPDVALPPSAPVRTGLIVIR